MLTHRLDELLAIVFTLLLLILSQLRDAPVIEPLIRSKLSFRTFAGVFVLLTVLFTLRFIGIRVHNLRRCLVEFGPLLLALVAYESLKHMHATALTVWLGIRPKDSYMLAIDMAIFGRTPYLWLDLWGFNDRAFISIMSFFYSLYYVLPILALSWFMLANDMRQFRLLRRGLVITLYGGYCAYVFIPVAGPLSSPHPAAPLFFENMTEFRFLIENFRYSFDCFPSLHTAIPWLIVFLCRKKIPRWLMILAVAASVGITISTIALRFHYGIDVIAGLGWAFFASRFARISLPKEPSPSRDSMSKLT